MQFSDFNLHPTLQQGIDDMGYSSPTPIQAEAIPVARDGRDVVGCAKTGTGKTAAFLIPIMHRLLQQKNGKAATLILSPTRELAQQIDQIADGLRYHTELESISIYGGGDGADFDVEKNALKNGADLVVATPGRILSHLNMGYIRTNDFKYLILDEADRMLDMGFQEDVMRIIRSLPNIEQRLLFSATMPKSVRQFAGKFLKDPAEITLAVSKTADRIEQAAYSVDEDDKVRLLKHLLKTEKFEKAIVFATTKASTKYVSAQLQKAGFPARSIHSDKSQKEREEIMLDFKTGKIKTLIATDIVSRGIDIESIELIINYHVPGDPEDYVHRVGRTARADKKGKAITLINQRDQSAFLRIEKLTDQEVNVSIPEGDYRKIPFDREAIRNKRHTGKRHHGRSQGKRKGPSKGRRRGGRPNRGGMEKKTG